MPPESSEGQEESRVMAELNAFVNNGWELDEEQIGIQKTYRTYIL
jgi:hypothetical protein